MWQAFWALVVAVLLPNGKFAVNVTVKDAVGSTPTMSVAVERTDGGAALPFTCLNVPVGTTELKFEVTITDRSKNAEMRAYAYSGPNCTGLKSAASDDFACAYVVPPNKPVIHP